MLPLSRKKRKAYRDGVRVRFEDECPRIGSGWRWCSVKVGRKWVHLTIYSLRDASLKPRTVKCAPENLLPLND